jgi:hypothetical protein
MKTTHITLALFSLALLAACKKDENPSATVLEGNPFEIRAYNYSTNHFFVDTLYRQYYEQFYQTEPSPINPSVQLVEEEVWVSRLGGIPDPNERLGIAIIDLVRRPQGGYEETLRTQTPSPGLVEMAPLVRLDRSQYEVTADGYVGVISLNTNVQEQQIIGIAYRRADGTQFGEFVRDSIDTNQVLILKMLKPRNLQSNGRRYTVAWEQMLKNIYPIGGHNIKKQGFLLDIFRMIPGQENQNFIPPNERLLRVFGLDNFNVDGTPAPNGDHVFDFRPGRTIDQARGEIILPFLRPFDDGIKKYYHDKGIPLPDTTYLYPDVYDTTKTFAQQSINARYIIQGRANASE